jgi:YfiH family protein
MPTTRRKTGAPGKTKSKARDRVATKLRKSTTPARWHLRRSAGVQILESPRVAGLKWLVSGFSTVSGGASPLERTCQGEKSVGQVLNLGFTDWDSREHVDENRKRFMRALHAEKMRTIGLRQIHSDIIHAVGRQKFPQGEEAPKGDALITREPGVLLTVQSADCVPILLADIKKHAVAVIHSGWRGTAQRIAEKTLGRMQMEFGTNPRDVLAAIGPGIGGCCYEVGHDVVKEFATKFPNAADWFAGPFEALTSSDSDSNWLPWLTMRPPGHAPPPPTAQLDLIAANRAILTAAGIPVANVFSSDLCTACQPDLFFSYRRERTTGRMMAAIGIR